MVFAAGAASVIFSTDFQAAVFVRNSAVFRVSYGFLEVSVSLAPAGLSRRALRARPRFLFLV